MASVEEFWLESLRGTEASQFPEMPLSYNPIASAVHHHETTNLHWPKIVGLQWTTSNDADTIVQVAWAMLIAQYTNTTDIVLGRATGNGLVPLRIRLDWHAKMVDATKSIKENVQQATAHTGCHLAKLRSLTSDTKGACDFQFALAIGSQQTPAGNSDIGTMYALSAFCEIRDKRLSMQLRYDPKVLEDQYVERIAWQIDHLVRQLTKADAATTLDSIDLLSSQDRHQIWAYNAHLPGRIDETITSLLEIMAAKHPNALALDAWDGQMNYKQLMNSSERLSSWLVSQDIVAPGRRVPVCIEKSLWTTVIILAIARGGGVFVVLDPAMPISHLSRITEDLQARHTVCTPMTMSVARDIGLPICMLDGLQMTTDTVEPHLQYGNTTAAPQITGDSPLYVVYTSGSTGAPKGALISHANLCSAARYQAPVLGFSSKTRSFDYSSYSFDAYIFNTFYTLLTGGCLCVPSDDDRLADLKGAIRRMNVNLIQLTPSVARLVDPRSIPEVKTLILTGEKIQAADLLPWLGRVQVINAYGPSECTIMCAANVDLKRPDDGLRIGAGIGCVLWLQDAINTSRLAPLGAIGEIIIEGPIVGMGYLKNDELTKKTHFQNPQWLLEGPGEDGRSGRRGIVYRTGDFAKYASDGTLVYLGRLDSQTKLHGQRIETTAIESHLRQILPEGYECAVDVVSTSTHSQLLVGFLRRSEIVSQNHPEIHELVASIKGLLIRQLPSFMVPSLFMAISLIPMTNSGKIDRRRLRQMAMDASPIAWVDGAGGDTPWLGRNGNPDGEHIADPLESVLKKLWVRVLGNHCTTVQPQDSFFQCGGDSIVAIKLSAAATQEGYKLDVVMVLRNPRLTDMARFLAKSTSKQTNLSAVKNFSSASLLECASSKLLQHLAKSCRVEIGDIEDVYPCSAIQEAMLSVTAQRPGSFIMQKVIPLSSTVNIEKMREAWGLVEASNHILRTRAVDTTTDGLLQVVMRYSTRTGDRSEIIPRVHELDSMDRGSPLVHVNFTTSRVDEHGRKSNSMVLTMHHAVYDAWSIDLYLRQLMQAYEGKSLVPSVQYRDFIEDVVNMDVKAAERFWSEKLATTEAEQFPALPGKDYQPLAQSTIHHFASDISWPSQIDITPATMVRASCALLLASYTNSSDVVFGATVLGRQSTVHGIERLTGPTIATLPVRAELNWDATAHEVLTAFQTQALDAIPFEQYGISRIRRLNHGANQACQFQTLLVVQAQENQSEDESPLDGALRYRVEDENISSFSTQALTIICFLETNGLRLCLSFDERVLTKSQAQHVASQIEHILRQFCTQDLKCTPLRHIETASPKDLQQVWEWNASVPETVSRCIHDTIAVTATQLPNALAVDGWDGQFTYAELLHTATQLASQLQAMGVGPEVMVPTCFEKSVWAAVSMLAVIIAGGVGVALDASQPEERLQHIIAQTGACLVLAGVQTTQLAQRLAPAVIVVELASFEGPHSTIPATPVLAREGEEGKTPRADNALFVVFTSGSTGVPKGAVITHAGFSSATKHQRKAFGMTQATRVLDFASYAFDVAWFDLLHTLAVGACICIPSDSARRDNLVATIRQFDANYLFLTPSLGRYLDSQCAPTIKDLIMGGEGVGRGDMTGWSDDVRVRVAYGPAECTVMSNVAVFSAAPGQVPIPSVIHTGPGLGVNCWIVSCFNPDLLAPFGAVGELVLEGPLLGRGYLKDPEKTAIAFTHNPAWLARGGPGFRGRRGRIYHTGDLVKFTDEGALVIVGRNDAQVKIRGQRVELEEVETHARRLLPDTLSSATLAADVVVPHGQTTKILALFIAATEKIDSTVQGHVLRGLANTLPVYMVPSAFVSLYTIPTTATGKVSRKGLRELAAAVPLDQFFAEVDVDGKNGHVRKTLPVTEVEKQLHTLWAKILGLGPSDIGLEDNFLHIGGDSVSAMRLAGHAHERGLPLTVVMILRKPRLDDMSRAVSEVLESQLLEPSTKQPELPNGTKPIVAKMARIVAQKLGSAEDNIVDIFPVTEFQQHSIGCAELRPRAEWGLFSMSMTGVGSARLRQACDELCKTIEILRTTFVSLDNGLSMHAVVLRDLQSEIMVQDVYGSLDEAMYSFTSKMLSQKFSAGQSTIAFAILHQPDTQKSRLIISMSHAHYDGLSLSLIVETLAALYQQRPIPRLVPFSLFLHESSLRTPANYLHWRNLLRSSSMTYISPRHSVCPEKCGTRTKVSTDTPIVLPRDGVTAATVIYASWARVLSSLTGSADVVFGRLVSGRNSAHAGFHNVVGPCINYVPVQAKLGEREPFHVLADLQDQYIQGLPHESLGLSEIVDQCTDWLTGSAYGSTVHYQNVEEQPLVSLDGKNYVRLEGVENSGEADAPGCVRLTAYPSGSKCKLELSMPPEFGLSETQIILQTLTEAVDFFTRL